MPDLANCPFDVHGLPNGTVVFYRDTDHSYWSDVREDPKKGWCGKGRLTGVSTVVAPLDFRPDNLMRWAARLNGEGIAALAAEGLGLDDVEERRDSLRWLASGESIWQALSDARLTYMDLRDDAAARGTNVHKHALHALATGSSVPDFDAMTDEEKGYARGVMAFWHECEPEPLQAEQVVADTLLGVAGRFDLRARVRVPNDLGSCVALVDAKTSGFISPKAHAQLAGYEDLAVTSGIGESDRRLILQVGADGSYELIDSEATTEDFSAALQAYRASGRITSAANRARKTREALAAA